MLHIISIGLGICLPIQEISTIATSGRQLNVSYTAPIQLPLITSLTCNSFDNEILFVDTYQISFKTRIRSFKNFHISPGVGIYYIKVNSGAEVEMGYSSFLGIYLPILSTENYLLASEMLFSSAPQSISINLNIGIKL